MTKISSLSDLRPKTVSIQLHHPHDKDDLLVDAYENPMMIEVVGVESNIFRNAVFGQMRSELDNIDKIGDPQYRAEKNLRLAAACLVGWTANDVLGEYSKERALELCLDGDFAWLVEQINAVINDRKRFFKV
jgi:hypothetical protein